MGGVPASNFQGTSAVLNPLLGHVEDHLPTAQKRRHGLQQLGLGPQNTDSGGSAHLVAGEGHEVGPHLHYVGGQVRGVLAGVHHHQRSGSVGCVGQLPDGVDGAQHVGHRGHAQQPGAVEQAVEIGQIEVAVVSDGEPAQLDAPLGGKHVPGDDVGMVLQLGDDHRVARSQIGMAPGSGHQVDRLSSVLGEDHLGGPGCADKAGDLGPGLLQSLGGFHRQLVGAAVDVGVEALVVVGEGRRSPAWVFGRWPPSRDKPDGGRAPAGT